MTYKVGRHYRCPVCRSPEAKIVWIGEDGKIIAVQCPKSHKHKRRTVMVINVEGLH